MMWLLTPLLTLCLTVALAQAATRHVAITGSDAAGCDGTMRTIGAGVQCLQAGDTLLIHAGTYQESLTDGGIPGGTSWDAPVTIKGAPGEQVIWQAVPGCAYPDDCRSPLYLRSATEQYLSFESLIFDGNNRTTGGVLINGDRGIPQHLRFLNIEVREVTGNFMGLFHTRDVTIRQSTFHDACCDFELAGQTLSSVGFYINDVHDLVMDAIEVHHAMGYGIQIYGGGEAAKQSSNITLRNSRIHHNGQSQNGGMVIADVDGVTLTRNLFYRNGLAAKGSPGGAIAIGHGACAANVQVYHNTITQNYTASPSGAAAVYVQCGAGHILRNNILWDNEGPDYAELGGSATQEHNLIGIDPRFIDAAAADFRLQTQPTTSPTIDAAAADSRLQTQPTKSPAIDAGVDVGLPYAGQAPDQGACEVGMTPECGSSGTLDPTPPRRSAPTSLPAPTRLRVSRQAGQR